ncbi:DUF397 domain-containing protein [Nocardiopsis dassonvillei]|uniref:DUF397 domain-containing protein n=1 Tax=Nocardiopsis dassonvillei TaxID=2014 RepID=UPI003F562A46
MDRALKAEGELLRAWRQDTFGIEVPVRQQKVALLEERSLAVDRLLPTPVPGLLQCESGSRCVEVSEGVTTGVRDTRHRELGHLEFTASEWTALVDTVEQHA